MMKRTHIALLILPLLLECGAPRPATGAETRVGTLTLDEAIRLTREHNPVALQTEEAVRAADAKVTEARSAFYPQVSAKAGYQHIDPISKITMGPLAFKLMPEDAWDARITAEMLLFDFGRSGRTVDLAKSARAGAGYQRDLALRDLSLASVRAFYGVMFLEQAVRVEDKEITALKTNLEHTQQRYRQGIATRFDLLTTEVRLSAAQNRRIDLQKELDNQRINLRRLCGLDAATPLKLQGSFDIPKKEMDSDMLAAETLERRPEIMIARENARAAALKRSLAVKENLPKIVGSASWGSTNGYQPDIYDMRNNVSAAVQIQMPLFTGFRNSASTREATAIMHAAEQERLDTEQAAQAEVRQAVNGLHASSDKIGSTTLQVSQADLAAQHARTLYQNGLATTLDLLEAEARLSEAELANLQARYEYVLNAYAVRRASGDLIAQPMEHLP